MAWNEWSKRSAHLLVKADWPAAEKLWKHAQRCEHTIGAWMMTGSWDMMFWFDAQGWEDVYEYAVWVRGQKGVHNTSSHFVYRGAKNGKWWWEWPCGSWVFARSPHLNGDLKNVQKWSWATSAVSIPGDWDYLVWAGGQKWEDVWGHVSDLNRAGWRTRTCVPVKSWWNRSWRSKWWA